jgi:uncharacterized protein (TIGR03437 family)
MPRFIRTSLWLSAALCWAIPNYATPNVLADLPVTFERNQGQWPRTVAAGAHIGGHQYWFSEKEIVIDAAIHLELISSAHGKWETLDPVESKTNYLNGRDSGSWIRGVSNYSRIRRHNAFPGVDLILYGSHGRLEFDYMVAAGASPDRIRLRISGAAVESDGGNLRLTTSSGAVLEIRVPFAYQGAGSSRRQINCQFRVGSRNEVAFTMANYNHELPLVIDPILTYLDYVPSTGLLWAGRAFPVVSDAAGNFYLSGTTYNGPIETTPGTVRSNTSCTVQQGAPSLCTEAWVIKFNPKHQIIWATYIGPGSATQTAAIGLDADDNVVLGGATGSSNFPVTAGAYLSSGRGFLTKISSNGAALVYSTYLKNAMVAIKMDSQGAVYFSDGQNIGKLSADASTMLYSVPTPGGVNQIAIDDSGNLYALSGASSQYPLTPGAYSSTDSDPLFVLKFDPQGNPVFAASFNAPVPRYPFVADIGVDRDGRIVFTGQAGAIFPLTNDPDPQTNDCDPAAPCMAFVAALDNTGSVLEYARLLGHGMGEKLGFGPNGDVYVAGIASDGYFPRTFDAVDYCSVSERYVNVFQNVPGGPPSNGFVMRLDSTGQREFSSFLGTRLYELTSVQIAANGDLYISGYGSGYYVAVIDASRSPGIPHFCLVNATQNVQDTDAPYQYQYVAPGQMVTLFGEGLGPQEPASSQWNADGSLANSLAGVRVLFDGVPAPILFAQANQINCIVPFGVAANQTTSIVVQYAGAQSDAAVFHVVASVANPFTKDYYPGSDVLAINQDGTMNSADNAAPRNSIVTFLATGLGQTNPPLKDGQIATGRATVVNGTYVGFFSTSPDAGGGMGTILYQGAAPGQVAGLYQLTVRIPPNALTGHTKVQFSWTPNKVYSSEIVTEGIWLK